MTRAASALALCAFAGLALSALSTGCAAPHLARDGTLVFPEQGARGAAILTANGVEFRDRADIPARVVRRDANERWSAPVGFILPKDGRFTQTSQATVITTPGLAVVLRPSDTRVPSWGGEVLVRLEITSPAQTEQARAAERFALVVDTSTTVDPQALLSLVEASLDGVAARDRVAVVDGAGTTLAPALPGKFRTLALATVEKRASESPAEPRPLAALAAAAKLSRGDNPETVRRIIVLTDAASPAWDDPAVAREVEKLAGEGVRVSFIGTTSSVRADRVGNLAMIGAGIAGTSPQAEDRERAARLTIPPSGDVRFKNLVVGFSGVPAPTQVIEASGGEVRWRLDEGELALGDISAGEAHTEVLRVSVPAWVPGEPFQLRAEARFVDVERNEERSISAEMHSVYDEDIERIADSRAGDVIAFASALATLKRLDRAFVGPGIDRVGGLRALANLHARSMSLLARDTKDPAIREQAEVLAALLGVSR